MDMSWRKLAVLIPLATMTWVGPAASADPTVDGPDKQVPTIQPSPKDGPVIVIGPGDVLPDEVEELDPVPIPEEPKPPKEPPRKLAACVMPKGLNTINGTPGPDDIVGSPKDDLILGLGGNDTIRWRGRGGR